MCYVQGKEEKLKKKKKKKKSERVGEGRQNMIGN